MAPRKYKIPGSKYKWTVPEENFIVKQYLKVPQPTDITVKRAFRKEFYPDNPRKLKDTRPADLRRIYDRFVEKGIFRSFQASDVPKRPPNREVTEAVESYMEDNPTSTLEKAGKFLNIPTSTVIITF